MKKLKELIVSRIIGALFIILVILFPAGIISGIIKFYSSSYEPSLLKYFLQVYMLKKLLFFLPSIFIAILFYTINSSFPKSVQTTLNIEESEIKAFFTKLAMFFMAINIILIELLSTTLLLEQEKLELKDRFLKTNKLKLQEVTKLFKEAEKYLQNEEYYKSLDLYQEILIIMPNYKKAEEQIETIEEKLLQVRENEFKKYLNAGKDNYNNKKYKEALETLKNALDINPKSDEALKYYSLSTQALNLQQKKIIKDDYSYLISLYKAETNEVSKQKRIYDLIKKGREEFEKKNYLEARKEFKKVLLEEPKHYSAHHYLSMINQRLAQITYYTSMNNKIFKTNSFYINTKNELVIAEKLAKTDLNEYIFFNTTFYNYRNNKLTKNLTKRYGYYDFKKKRFVFLNSFLADTTSEFRENINPDIMWYYYEIIDSPENFPFYKIANFYKYFKTRINSFNKFIYIGLIKLCFYIILVLLFICTLTLGLKLKRKTGKPKIGIISFIFLPVLAIIFNQIFINLFLFIKKLVSIFF